MVEKLDHHFGQGGFLVEGVEIGLQLVVLLRILETQVENVEDALESPRVGVGHPGEEGLDLDVLLDPLYSGEVDAADVAQNDDGGVAHILVLARADQFEHVLGCLGGGEEGPDLEALGSDILDGLDHIVLYQFVFLRGFEDLVLEFEDCFREHPLFGTFVVGVVDLGGNVEQVLSEGCNCGFLDFHCTLLLYDVDKTVGEPLIDDFGFNLCGMPHQLAQDGTEPELEVDRQIQLLVLQHAGDRVEELTVYQAVGQVRVHNQRFKLVEQLQLFGQPDVT